MEMKIIDERELFNRNFKIYGTVDEPLFLSKNIADLIEYSEGMFLICVQWWMSLKLEKYSVVF